MTNLQLINLWIEEHKKHVAIGLIIATVLGIVLTQISWSSPSSSQAPVASDTPSETTTTEDPEAVLLDKQKDKTNKLSFADVNGYSYDIEYIAGSVVAATDTSEGKPGYVGISKASMSRWGLKITNTTSGKKAPCLMNMSLLPVYTEQVSTELKQLLRDSDVDTLYNPGWELKSVRLYDTPLASTQFNDGNDDNVPSQQYSTLVGLKVSLKAECGNGIDNRMDAGAVLEDKDIAWSADNAAIVKEGAASRIVELLKKPAGYVVAYSDYTTKIYQVTLGEGVKAYGNMNGDAILQFVRAEEETE